MKINKNTARSDDDRAALRLLYEKISNNTAHYDKNGN